MENLKTARIELPSGAIMHIVQEYFGDTHVRTYYELESDHVLPTQIRRKLQPKAERRATAFNGLIFNPSLLLAGAWMSKAGFTVGDQVTVTVDQGIILITY